MISSVAAKGLVHGWVQPMSFSRTNLVQPMRKRNNSRSRSPAAERAMPAAAEVDKPADEVTPKKGGHTTKDDGP